jgi:hypothetical protein
MAPDRHADCCEDEFGFPEERDGVTARRWSHASIRQHAPDLDIQRQPYPRLYIAVRYHRRCSIGRSRKAGKSAKIAGTFGIKRGTFCHQGSTLPKPANSKLAETKRHKWQEKAYWAFYEPTNWLKKHV